MQQKSEYHAAMIDMVELIWGPGFLVPGGAGNVAKLVEGLDVRGRRALDIGSGLGGPAFVLAEQHGAEVVGMDVEPQLVELSNRRAAERGLAPRAEFVLVEPGPLPFPDASFDLVISMGAIVQIAAKRELFAECLRVLRPGGWLSCYDWVKPEGPYRQELLDFIEAEQLTYALETAAFHERILREVGFEEVKLTDGTAWFRPRVQQEYERIRTDLYPRMRELMSQKEADHFVENWRTMAVVFDTGALQQVYYRGRKPA